MKHIQWILHLILYTTMATNSSLAIAEVFVVTTQPKPSPQNKEAPPYRKLCSEWISNILQRKSPQELDEACSTIDHQWSLEALKIISENRDLLVEPLVRACSYIRNEHAASALNKLVNGNYKLTFDLISNLGQIHSPRNVECLSNAMLEGQDLSSQAISNCALIEDTRFFFF